MVENKKCWNQDFRGLILTPKSSTKTRESPQKSPPPGEKYGELILESPSPVPRGDSPKIPSRSKCSLVGFEDQTFQSV